MCIFHNGAHIAWVNSTPDSEKQVGNGLNTIPLSRIEGVAKVTRKLTIQATSFDPLKESEHELLTQFYPHCHSLDLLEVDKPDDYTKILSHNFPKVKRIAFGGTPLSFQVNVSFQFPSLRVLGLDVDCKSLPDGNWSSLELLHIKTWASTRELKLPRNIGIKRVAIEISPRFRRLHLKYMIKQWNNEIRDFIESENIEEMIFTAEMESCHELYNQISCNVRFLHKDSFQF
jgi:hypothetical protein